MMVRRTHPTTAQRLNMNKSYSPLTRIHVLALAAVLLAALNSLWLDIFSTLDSRLSDLFVREVEKKLSPDPDIVIVNIDEASLAAMQDTAGSWPWPRAVHAELLQGIARQQPRAIVFDILFSEPDRYRPESDQFFNEVLHDLPYVYFPMLQLEGNQTSGVPLKEVPRILAIPRSASATPEARAILLPPQAVAPESWRAGLINLSEDADGIARRYELFRALSGWKLESLPARVMRDLGYAIPQQPDISLHWRGNADTFKHISYGELYADQSRRKPQRDAHELTGKIVIIGSTATGLHDIRAAGRHAADRRATAIVCPAPSRCVPDRRRIAAAEPCAAGLAIFCDDATLQRRAADPAAVRLGILFFRGAQRVSAREKITRTNRAHLQPLSRSARGQLAGGARRDPAVAERAGARDHGAVFRHTRLHHAVGKTLAGGDRQPAEPLLQPAS